MRQIKPPTPPERKGENQQTKTGMSFAQPNDRVKKKAISGRAGDCQCDLLLGSVVFWDGIIADSIANEAGRDPVFRGQVVADDLHDRKA